MLVKRNTDERALVLKVLSASHVPLTVSEIKKKVGAAAHTATVYRALQVLILNGSVRRVDMQSRAARYESNSDHHHHIVCTGCGVIEDVHTEPKGLESRVLDSSKRFKSITSHSLEFFGVCKKCD